MSEPGPASFPLRRGPGSASPQTLREHLAVLACLLDAHYADAGERLRSTRPSPSDFLRFAERNLIGGFLVRLLDASGLRNAFPDDELDTLLRATERRSAMQAPIPEAVSNLWPRLEGRGIDATLLKGPYLAERFYGGTLNRSYGDLDLMVRPSQVPALDALLVEAGYRRLSRVLLSRRVSLRFTHGFDYVRDGLRLDAHWSLGSHVSYRIDYDRVWRERRRFRLSSGDEVAVLSDEDALFFHLLSTFEDIDRGSFRFRSFVDVHAMLSQLESEIDWPAFWERRRIERTERICRTVLALFLVLFAAEERFPHSSTGVAAEIERTRSVPWDEIHALVEASPGALRNKRWGLGIYECSALRSALWWIVSLPFRLSIYHRRP